MMEEVNILQQQTNLETQTEFNQKKSNQAINSNQGIIMPNINNNSPVQVRETSVLNKNENITSEYKDPIDLQHNVPNGTSGSNDGNNGNNSANATNGNFAGLDTNGNLTDSGKKAADFATAAQGTKADSAIQSVEFAGTTLTVNSSKKASITQADARTALGLGTAAYENSSAFDAAGVPAA